MHIIYSCVIAKTSAKKCGSSFILVVSCCPWQHWNACSSVETLALFYISTFRTNILPKLHFDISPYMHMLYTTVYNYRLNIIIICRCFSQRVVTNALVLVVHKSSLNYFGKSTHFYHQGGHPKPPEPALGEGEQGPRPGPRTSRGPAGHQRGAPHRTMRRPRGAGPQRGEPRMAAFLACDSHILILGPPQCAGRSES